METTSKKKAIIVYHSCDADGLSSYCIASQALTEHGYYVEKLGYNYGDEIPGMTGYDLVCIVDISFPPEIMMYLWKEYNDNILWIDHHITAINASEEHGYSTMPGLREVGLAACELTWKFFYPEPTFTTPEAIRILGIYDTWRKKDVGEQYWENIVVPFQSGVKFKFGLNPDMWKAKWHEIVYEWAGFLETGKIITEYQEHINTGIIKRFAFPVRVAGRYKGICLLGTGFSSLAFKSVLQDYDLYIVCNRKGPDEYTFSIYGEPDRGLDFNCGEYVKQLYRGGGHALSAGGLLNYEQFERLVKDCEL